MERHSVPVPAHPGSGRDSCRIMRTPRRVDALPPQYRGREQTFIKHLILRRYLETVAWHILWAQDDFVFVDGFSGPWAATSTIYEDTSFGIAMTLLRRVRDELKG